MKIETFAATASMAFLLSVAAPLMVVAHAGHDHDGPSATKAPKGGVIKDLEEAHIEVVSKGREIKVYAYDKDMNPRPTAGLKVSAIAELPRKRGESEITLTDSGDHFKGEYDAKGAHRYTLILKVMDSKTGHDDQLKYTIEPRRK